MNIVNLNTIYELLKLFLSNPESQRLYLVSFSLFDINAVKIFKASIS